MFVLYDREGDRGQYAYIYRKEDDIISCKKMRPNQLIKNKILFFFIYKINIYYF